MKSLPSYCAALAAFALLLPAAAGALTFVKAPDEEMVDRSPIIVRAVARPQGPRPADADFPLTFYSLEVKAALRGAAEGEILELAVPGGFDARGFEARIIGAPAFANGEEALLFLERSPAGHLRVVHFHQGVFRLGRLAGKRAAWRDFGEDDELAAAGGELSAEPPRDLAKFEAWIGDRLAGTARPADYRLARPPAGGLENAIEPFAILERNGLPTRWDKGSGQLAITFYAHPAPQPGVPGGGHDRVQHAVDVWNGIPGGNLRLRYGGLTDTTAGFHYNDGVNAYVFNDFDDANGDAFGFDCATQSGALAYARIWIAGSHVYGGREYATIVNSDSVVSKDTNCWSRFTPGAFERTVAHEMGHMLGLNHTCSREEGDPCANPDERLSILYPGNPGGNTGAFLGEDDRRAIRYLYGVPEAPAALRAQVSDRNRVSLFWEDHTDNETGYAVFRESAGREELLGTLGADSTRFDDDATRPSTVYLYRVRARNENGLSAAAEVTATTVALDTPAQLGATATGPHQVALAWVDKSGEENGYEVWGRFAEGGGDELLASLPANSQAATITDLIADSTYTFKVRATGVPTGNTAFSNTAQATTLPAPIEPCTEGGAIACLQADRFKIEVRWKDFQGVRGSAAVAPAGSADSGIFYFFSPNNWEMLVKVLDGCAINNKVWVFAAATTNVAYVLEVTDTETGAVKTYSNPLGHASAAIGDIAAFSSCASP